jgi:hypothetical protein
VNEPPEDAAFPGVKPAAASVRAPCSYLPGTDRPFLIRSRAQGASAESCTPDGRQYEDANLGAPRLRPWSTAGRLLEPHTSKAGFRRCPEERSAAGSAAFAGRFGSECGAAAAGGTPGPARHPSGVRRGVAVQSPRDKRDSTAPVRRLGGGRRVPPDHPGGHAPDRQGRAAKSRPSHSPVPFSITIRYYRHLNPFPNHPDPP